METVTDFVFWGSKFTADGDWSREIKRLLLLGRKAMTNQGSILKSRDITLPTKVCVVKAMVFPVVMYGCESWTIKKAERQRTDASRLWCWRRLLRVPWTARRSNQSILKEINPEYLLEGLMLKLKLQCFGHGKDWLIGKDPDDGKDWGREEKGTTEDTMVGWHHWLNGCEFEQPPRVGDGQGGLAAYSPWGSQRVRHNVATELSCTGCRETLQPPLPSPCLCPTLQEAGQNYQPPPLIMVAWGVLIVRHNWALISSSRGHWP